MFGGGLPPRRRRRRGSAAFTSDFRDLKIGDHVVHIDHGVAKFLGRWELSGASQYDLETSRSLNYVANLVRHDHDFSLFFRIDYDNISGETNISLNFEPNFTGAFRSKRERSLYGGRLYGGGDGTIF